MLIKDGSILLGSNQSIVAVVNESYSYREAERRTKLVVNLSGDVFLNDVELPPFHSP